MVSWRVGHGGRGAVVCVPQCLGTGRPAYRLEYRGTKEGVRLRLVALAILLDRAVLVLTCEAPERSFAEAAPAIEATLESLRARP